MAWSNLDSEMSSVNIWDGEHCKNSKLLAAVKYCYKALHPSGLQGSWNPKVSEKL